MNFVIAGTGLIALSVVYLAVKLRVVYWIARDPGSAGGVPTLDALFVPPAFVTIGVVFVLDGMSVWAGMGIWATSVVVSLLSMWVASILGSRQRSG